MISFLCGHFRKNENHMPKIYNYKHTPFYLSLIKLLYIFMGTEINSARFVIFICNILYTECSLHIVFFSKNSGKFATSPSPALGCYWLYKNYQPIGVTVHLYCVEIFEGLLQ